MAVAAGGFLVIAIAFGTVTLTVFGVWMMGDCALSDAEIARGATCGENQDLIGQAILGVGLILLVGLQWPYLRWALRAQQV